MADTQAFSENGRRKEGAVTKNSEARKLWHEKLIQILHDPKEVLIEALLVGTNHDFIA